MDENLAVRLDLTNPRHLGGLLGIAIGTGLLGACIWEFALLDWAIWFLAANLFVMGYEEPTLRQRFGPEFDSYVRSVGRWLPNSSSSLRSPRPVPGKLQLPRRLALVMVS